jgi:hypothetical protein
MLSDKPNSGRVTNTAGERRRQAILDAAWSLFLEKGYPAVSVDEIISVSSSASQAVRNPPFINFSVIRKGF